MNVCFVFHIVDPQVITESKHNPLRVLKLKKGQGIMQPYFLKDYGK